MIGSYLLGELVIELVGLVSVLWLVGLLYSSFFPSYDETDYDIDARQF